MDGNKISHITNTLFVALPDDVIQSAYELLDTARKAEIKLATAESCTAGMIASLLTDFEGLSHVFDRGFVTYSEASKIDMLGIPPDLLASHDAVSEQVAREMARSALIRSEASLTIAVTGYTGKADIPENTGLVHFACARSNETIAHEVRNFGDIGRGPTRIATIRTALKMLHEGLHEIRSNPS